MLICYSFSSSSSQITSPEISIIKPFDDKNVLTPRIDSLAESLRVLRLVLFANDLSQIKKQ